MVARSKNYESSASPTDVLYEIHANRLCVNDECFPVSRRVIRLALIAHQLETGEDYHGENGPIPESIFRRIIKMERTRSINALASGLLHTDAAPRSDEAKSFEAPAI